MRRDEVADGALVVERGVDGCLRPRRGDVREDALGTAALVQIIVDESGVQPPDP
jgi:hypothetical protein